MVSIRKLEKKDCFNISKAFLAQGWHKSKELYNDYLRQQNESKRLVFIAEVDGEFAAYITLVNESDYPYFKENGIKEVMDLNVLKKFQRKGIATKLLNYVESIVSDQYIGLCVGLLKDYGAAQNFYIKQGYFFDKQGISTHDKYCQYNDTVEVNDDLVLGMIKKL